MNTSVASNQPISTSRSLKQWMQGHPLFSYFFMAYAVSWILSIPVILSEWYILPKTGFTFYFFFTIKSFGPFLAAYIMTRIMNGKEGWPKLRDRFKLFRVGWQWYIFILLGVPAIMALGIIVLPGALSSFQGFPPHFVITYLITFVLI